MSSACQGKNKPTQKPQFAEWDQAIADVRKRIKELQFTLSVFEQRKNAGEPWPGAESQAQAVIHA